MINLLHLVYIFYPIFIFSKQELYYPCNIDYIISNSQLYDHNYLLVKNYTKLTDSTLGSNIGKYIHINPSLYDYKCNYKCNYKYDNNYIYYFIRNRNPFIDITYILFYAYNGPYNIFGYNIGEHQADIEYVIIRLCCNYGNDTYNKHNYKLHKIYLSAHGDEGKWYNSNQLIYKDMNPIIYVAQYSHAHYPKIGIYYRYFGLANDITSLGRIWIPNNFIHVTNSYPKWMNYTGFWSMDGISNIINRDWYL